MNNKGFAITAVIYGLAILGFMIIAILMGTLSSTRNNVSEEANMVEDFLIAANQTEVTYHGSVNTVYRVPLGSSGWYRFEAFGANMGQSRGAYTTGIIYLNESDTVTISITNQASTVLMGSTVLMRASAAVSTSSPGGVIRCYSTAPTGGRVNLNTYRLVDETQSYTGVEGVNFTNCSNNNYVTGILGHPSSSLTTTGTHDYYFVDGLMIPAANGSGEGKILIQRLAERDETIPNIPRKNAKFNGVTKITVSTGLNVQKIRWTYHDDFDGEKFVEHVEECSGTSCTLSGAKNLDDVTVVIDPSSYKSNAKNTTLTFETTSGVKTIYSATGEYGYTPGPAGLHFSAYQPDSRAEGPLGIFDANNAFPDHGNYYLIPVVAENMVVSATLSGADDSNQLKIEPLTGESRQKWAIDLLNRPGSAEQNFPNVGNRSNKKEYRITELTRYKSLNIYYDENYKMNFVSASETFNSLSRNEPQIWNIFPMGDGTYAIKTVVPSFTISEKSGFLLAKPFGENNNNDDDVLIGLAKEYNNGAVDDLNTTPTPIERFFLYSLDFSV